MWRSAHRAIPNRRAAAAKRLATGGQRVVVVQADLNDRAATDRAADEVIEGLGGLDIFVHSAGIDVTKTAPTHETPDDTWDRMLAMHLTAAFRLSKTLVPALLKGTKPSVTFIGSVAGMVAWEGDVAYNVAKAGLHHLARCIAADYAKQGLRANVIAPGVIDTPLTRSYASGMEGGEASGMKVLAGASSRSAAMQRLKKWRAPPSFSPPTRPPSSPASCCRSMAA